MPGKKKGPGKWIENRAKSILDDDMKKRYGDKAESVSYAIATQQAHKVGKTPKKGKGPGGMYGTKEGKREAKSKYDKPKKEYKKTASARVPNWVKPAILGAGGGAVTGAITAPEGDKLRSAAVGAGAGGALSGLMAKNPGFIERMRMRAGFPSPNARQKITQEATAAGLLGGSVAPYLTRKTASERIDFKSSIPSNSVLNESLRKLADQGTRSLLKDFAAGVDPFGTISFGYGIRDADIGETDAAKRRAVNTAGGAVGGAFLMPALISGVMGASKGGLRGGLKSAVGPYKNLFHAIRASRGLSKLQKGRPLGDGATRSFLSLGKEVTDQIPGELSSKAKTLAGLSPDSTVTFNASKLSPEVLEGVQKLLKSNIKKGITGLGAGAGFSGGSAYMQYGSGRNVGQHLDKKKRIELSGTQRAGGSEKNAFLRGGPLEKFAKDRCWEGYKPVPGKKPYSEDSCRPVKSKKKEANVGNLSGKDNRSPFIGGTQYPTESSKEPAKNMLQESQQVAEAGPAPLTPKARTNYSKIMDQATKPLGSWDLPTEKTAMDAISKYLMTEGRDELRKHAMLLDTNIEAMERQDMPEARLARDPTPMDDAVARGKKDTDDKLKKLFENYPVEKAVI